MTVPGTATRVLGIPYTNLGVDGVTDAVARMIDRGTAAHIAVAPVSSLMQAWFDSEHLESLRDADLITPDGVPIVWAMRLLGHRRASRVYGPTLMLSLLERAAAEGWNVGLHGGHPENMDRLTTRLLEQFPRLRLSHTESPPFRRLTTSEQRATVQRIRARRVHLLFVGLGCPKQEAWMRDHATESGAVCVGVGAAFDFHAGTLAQAPSWIQSLGLEWAFRLACEPRRLWRRYATTIPPFMMAISVQIALATLLGRRFQVAPTTEPS